jgi:hypothetical protein
MGKINCETWTKHRSVVKGKAEQSVRVRTGLVRRGHDLVIIYISVLNIPVP